MKKSIFLFISAAAILLLAGCAKEADDSGRIPMRVAPTVAEETKGSLDSDNLQEFFLRIVSSDHLFCDCDKFSRAGSSWASSRQFYWKNDTDPVTYTAAYFGYHDFTAEEFDNGVILTLPNNQRSRDRINGADLIVVPSATIKCEDTADGVLPLAFSHALAKVRFVLTLSEDFYYNGYVSGGCPLINAFIYSTQNFQFTPATGEVVAQTDTKQRIKPFLSEFVPGTAADMKSKVVYEVILVPQTIPAGELSVTFNVCEDGYSWSNPEEITLSPGQNSDIYINVDFAPGPTQQINGHKYVEMGDGLKWATCNVGANLPQDNGDDFFWSSVDAVEFTKWRFGYSSYTQFINPKYNDRTIPTLLPEDDAATSNWGAPWRMPTMKEMSVLADREKFEWSGNESSGFWVISKVPGYEGNRIYFHIGKGSSIHGSLTNSIVWLSTFLVDDQYFDGYWFLIPTGPGKMTEAIKVNMPVRAVAD